ncbi:hypothetical protein Ae168Ps1_6200 [Pseudonocardia sp. Ae168_Ps1]|uniref:hypothetical protein n=1 Tax=unclassified Pseudonocardia TaxID=2619320 RepID=UPI00094B5D0A|nr:MULTISPECIES: hypothetical protein [unclassified Pseudonocardia]OLL70453.1 hypothetical protein Ae168Ps1_6200 [Pseudonocardia sp. Ae168_Ps1]OLL71572.1 hypothetical protein Ae263Ps1_6060 [Pseudonocardia sp. Ae263_Ps1]
MWKTRATMLVASTVLSGAVLVGAAPAASAAAPVKRCTTSTTTQLNSACAPAKQYRKVCVKRNWFGICTKKAYRWV